MKGIKMKKTGKVNRLWLLVLGILLPLHLTQAQTLDGYLQTAGENNPLLKARFSEYQAALARTDQVGGLPDPQLGRNFFLMPMERFRGNQLGELSLMQMFPWFGSLDAAKTEAAAMAQMKFSEFQEVKINLYHDVRTLWYNLYRIEEEIQLLQREMALLQSLENIALAKYKAAPVGGGAGASAPRSSAPSPAPGPARPSAGGRSEMGSMGGASTGATTGRTNPAMGGMGSMGAMAAEGGTMVDVLLIRIQLKELEHHLALARASRKPLAVAFNNLLNRPADQAIQVADTLTPVPLPASLSLIQDSLRLNHPLLRMYEWDEKAREAQLRMAQLMARPMIGLGLTYMAFRPRFDEGMQMQRGGGNMVMPMVTLTLPIYRKKYRAQQNEARHSQAAATHQKAAAERQLFSELETMLFDYESTSHTFMLIQDQISLTEQAIRLLLTRYSVAGAGIEEILRQRRTLVNYRQQQVQVMTDQHIAVSAINRLMGVDL
ncbi:TolC family protein [soil metagenome]